MDLPTELIYLIYVNLTIDDAIRLSLVCHQLHDGIPHEYKRISGIRRQYISINNAIKDIRYYVSNDTAISIRIGNQIVVYNIMGFDFMDQKYNKAYTVLTIVTRNKKMYMTTNNKINISGYPPAIRKYIECYMHSNRMEIYSIIRERNIALYPERNI